MHSAIPLASPSISQADKDAVMAVLDTSTLSLGPKLPEFEQAIADFTGTKHAVAVNSGTSALHLAIRALDIGEDDEVITTPFSFVASSNCMLFEKAKPVFTDIEADYFGLDPNKVEAAITPKTKAILAVDVFGYLADWPALQAIAKKHNLALIEDSCEAIGTTQNGQSAGTFADCGMFAFYPNKQITTGEGGVLVTDRDDIADAARSMRNQGRGTDGQFLHHVRLGFNYRLSDINCALGITQLQQLPSFIVQRQQATTWYAAGLAGLAEQVVLPKSQPNTEVSWFVYVIRLQDSYTRAQRDQLLDYLRAKEIGCNSYFPSIHLQPFYQEQYGYNLGDYPVCEAVSDRTIALPFFASITEEQIATVCATLKAGFDSLTSS